MIFYLMIPWFLLLLVVFQHTVLGAVFFHSIAVEISLVLVIYAGLRMEVVRGSILVPLLGLMMDCITGAGSGSYALVYVTVFLLVYMLSLHIYAESTLFLIVLTLCCGLLEGLLLLLLHRLLNGTNVFFDLVRFFLPQLLLVSMFSPFLFKMFHGIGWLRDGYVRSIERP